MRRFGIPIAGLCVVFFMTDSYLQAQPPNRGGQGQQGRGQGGGGGRDQGGGPGMGGPSAGGRGAGGRGSQGGGRASQQTPPLLRIFDANGDGELAEDEIKNAATALRKLDADRNGRLTAEELRPSGAAQSGPGGQRGAGQRGGGQQQGRGGAEGGMQNRPSGPGGERAGRGGGAGGPGGGGPGGGGPGGGRPGGGGPGGGAGRGGGDAAFAAQLIELDDNKDGQLTLAELPAHMHDAFKVADADKNEKLNEKEQVVLAQQFRRDRLPPPAEQGLERKNEPTQGQRPNKR